MTTASPHEAARDAAKHGTRTVLVYCDGYWIARSIVPPEVIDRGDVVFVPPLYDTITRCTDPAAALHVGSQLAARLEARLLTFHDAERRAEEFNARAMSR